MNHEAVKSCEGMVDCLGKAFDAGDWPMYPILFTSVIVLALVIERSIVLWKSSINKENFVLQLQKYVQHGQLDKAVALCNLVPKPLPNIVKAGLLKATHGSDADVQASMDEAALRELPRIEKRTAYIAMLSNVAMLFGLFGTILGLIKTFGAVGDTKVDPGVKSALLADGIHEAIHCTAFGLGVAIFALLWYSVFQGKTQSLIDDINEGTVRVLNAVVANRDKLKVKGAAGA